MANASYLPGLVPKSLPRCQSLFLSIVYQKNMKNMKNMNMNSNTHI